MPSQAASGRERASGARPLALTLEPFDPAALIRRVERRRPAAEVAALFGLETRALLAAVANLRRDDPDFPVRRRKLRRVVYVEPTPTPPPAGPSKACAGPCARTLPLDAFPRCPWGALSTTCRECCPPSSGAGSAP